MGCSNPHPHGQIWGWERVPTEPAKEGHCQQTYFAQHGAPLLVDYASVEATRRKRLVVEDAHWLAVVLYWAIWLFEAPLRRGRPMLRLPHLTELERDSLAQALKCLLTRYDDLFAVSFPLLDGMELTGVPPSFRAAHSRVDGPGAGPRHRP